MAQTVVTVLLHVVFSTKHRQNLITPEIEPALFAYMGGTARKLGAPCLAINGTANHVHLLVSYTKRMAMCDFMRELKKASSKWAASKGSALRWQDGYGIFSIGESQVGALEGYIARQKIRHRTHSFEEEYLALLRRYRVEYDERYIWD